MKTIELETLDPADVVHELLQGGGAVRFPKMFSAEQVSEAKRIIETATSDSAITGSHFNKDEDDALLQRRVWNLLCKGDVFVEMVQHPKLIESLSAFLGTDFVLGSYCASRTMPGFGGQEPHIDYPYWDYYRTNSFPCAFNASFPLNAQATFVIDPFTEQSGATAYWPESQKELRYPEPDALSLDNCERMTGEPGDVILFYGATWHCAMPNRSEHGRIGLLLEFLPKFVKPIEDMMSDLDEAFLESANKTLRQLLGLHYPWPSSPPHPPLK